MRHIFAIYFSGQFARYLVVGGIALMLNWLSRFVFNWFVGYGWAIVLAYLVGILVAFILNKLYVFPYSKRSLTFETSSFFFVNIAAFPFVWIVAYVLGEWILASWLPQPSALALGHGIAIVLPAFVNSALYKFITFRAT